MKRIQAGLNTMGKNHLWNFSPHSGSRGWGAYLDLGPRSMRLTIGVKVWRFQGFSVRPFAISSRFFGVKIMIPKVACLIYITRRAA